jgi:hypothetical protein
VVESQPSKLLVAGSIPVSRSMVLDRDSTQVGDVAGFEQAPVKVEREKEFEELKGAIRRALAPETADKFLRQMRSSGLRIRDLEGVLAKRVLEKLDKAWAKSAASGQDLYRSLTASDQGQMREFYLSQVEEVKPEFRTKFQKLYRYY